MKPKESSKYKICPLNARSGKICIESKCMWWCEFAQDCAVPLLAAMFADSDTCRSVFSNSKEESARPVATLILTA